MYTPTDETERLETLLQYRIVDTPPEERFDRITRLATRVFDVPLALVTLVDSDRQFFKSAQGIDLRETEREISFCAKMIDDGEPLLVPNAVDDDRFADNPFVVGPPGVRFYSGMPLRSQDGHVLGGFSVLDRRAREFSPKELRIQREMADLVEAELERGRRREADPTASIQFLSRLVTVLPGVLYVYDVNERRFRYVNRHIISALGYSPEEVQRQGHVFVEEHLHPADLQAWRERLVGNSQDQRVDTEFRMRHRDGSWRWFAGSEIAFEEHRDGATHELLGVAIDITHLKGVEQELRRREQEVEQQMALLETIYQSAPIGLCFLDPEGRYVYVNERLAEMNGRPPEEHIGDRAWEWEIVPDELADRLKALVRHVRLYRRPVLDISIDAATYARGSMMRSWLASLYPVIDGGSELQGISVVVQEVTEQKRAIEALRESEARFHMMAESAPVIIWTTDAQGRYTYANDQWQQFTGRTAEACRGSGWQASIHPDDRTRVTKAYRAAHAEKERFRIEYRLRRADGTYRWVIDIGSPRIEEEEGTLVGFIGCLTDISERKEFEKGLIEAKEAAEANARLRASILANMSHEIRTPLTGIIGFGEMLQEEVPPEYEEYTQVITANGRRLLDTLGSVLHLARLESGQVELALKKIDLNEAADEAAQLFDGMAERKGLDFIVERSDTPVPVRADHGALQRVLSNLASNAIKFTNEGHVLIRVLHENGRRGIAVEDTGVGIDEAFMPLLFEDFSQEAGGETRSHEGSGLGLAITKHLVEMMEGEIEVGSEKDEGTTFTIYLPPAGGDEEQPS